MTNRPDLQKIEASYNLIKKHWAEIDDQLYRKNIGRKDTPFDEAIMNNMLLAWDYLDFFIRKKDYDLFSNKGGVDMLEINHRVHYGKNHELRREYTKALEATTEKFTRQIKPIRNYYRKKSHKDDVSANKIAAEIYIAILGMPQLFIEGNHRSGSIIASWINLANNGPPFVLTLDNAVAYFQPAAEIKKFNKKSTWRSWTKLPKYKKEFKHFWKNNCDMEFIREDT